MKGKAFFHCEMCQQTNEIVTSSLEERRRSPLVLSGLFIREKMVKFISLPAKTSAQFARPTLKMRIILPIYRVNITAAYLLNEFE